MRGARAGAIVFAGITVLNVGNAVFHLFAARLLGPAEYGEVASLLALSGLLALPFGAIQVVIARFVAADAARDEAGAIASLVRRAVVATTVASLGLTGLLLLLSPLIGRLLGIDDLSPVLLTALYTIPALASPVLFGLAQGLQRFGTLAASMTIGTVVRVAALLTLIPFGVTAAGAMGATVVGGFASLIAPIPLLVRWLRRPPDPVHAPRTREVLRYFLPVSVGMLAITSLTTVDVIVAKVVLSDHQVGVYGSASLIGRLILYLPTTIATVLLPKVSSRAAAALDTGDIFRASLAVTAGLSALATILLTTIPKLVVDASFGSKFGDAASLLGLFGLEMTLFALVNVQLVYHLGRGMTRMAWLVLAGAVAELIAYVPFHGSPYQLLGVNIVTAAALVTAHEVLIERSLGPSARWLYGVARRR